MQQKITHQVYGTQTPHPEGSLHPLRALQLNTSLEIMDSSLSTSEAQGIIKRSTIRVAARIQDSKGLRVGHSGPRDWDPVSEGTRLRVGHS